jgi:hypothetical protein
MIPEVGRSRAAIRWSMVDLPQPDGPVTATDSPRSIRRLSPFRAMIIPPS